MADRDTGTDRETGAGPHPDNGTAGERPGARLSRALARRRAGARRPVLTGRALVLGGILVLLVVVLASPVNRYLAGREAVGQAAQQLREDRSQLADLRRQKARWSDPGYVQQRARATLQLAMPGDTVYQVDGPHGRSLLARTSGPGAGHRPAARAWNTRLWDSVRAAAQ